MKSCCVGFCKLWRNLLQKNKRLIKNLIVFKINAFACVLSQSLWRGKAQFLNTFWIENSITPPLLQDWLRSVLKQSWYTVDTQESKDNFSLHNILFSSVRILSFYILCLDFFIFCLDVHYWFLLFIFWYVDIKWIMKLIGWNKIEQCL